MSVALGQKLKYFRKRACLSQLDLEMRINAAAGMLSRIESGETNPTKETIEKIYKTLGLTLKQISYIEGPLAEPASEEEIINAQKEVEDYFNKKGVIAYLIDDRWRVFSASKSYLKLVGYSESDIQKFTGLNVMQFMLDENLKISKLFSKEEFHDLVYYQLLRYYTEAGFMVDDETYKTSVKLIKSIPFACNIWESIIEKANLSNIFDYEKKIINLSVFGAKIPMYLTREFLHKYPRFEVIEWFPTNILAKTIKRFI